MKYSLNLLLFWGATLILCGCDPDVDPAEYERPSSATSASPIATPGDSPASDEVEEEAYEEVLPEKIELPAGEETNEESSADDELDGAERNNNEINKDEGNAVDASDVESDTDALTREESDGNVEFIDPPAIQDSGEGSTSVAAEEDDTADDAEVSSGDSASVPDAVARVVPPVANTSDESDNPSANAKPEVLPASLDLEKREIQLLVEEKSFKTVGKPKALQVSYDDIDLLKVLNMEPVPLNAADYFPEWLKALDGQRIRIRGFMYPPFQETDIEKFLLARDNDICCFGRDPKIYDIIRVRMKEGVTTDYIPNRPFDVVGVFRIVPEPLDDEKLLKLYQIDDAIIINK